MKVSSSKPVSQVEALKMADELEQALGKIVNGEWKPAKMPLEPLCKLIQFTRDSATNAKTQPDASTLGEPVIVATGTTLIFKIRDGLQTNLSNPLLTEALNHLKIDGQDWSAKATMPREAFKALNIYIAAFGDGMAAATDTRATVGKKAAPLMPSDNKTIKTK